MSLADEIRAILRNASGPMTAREVRETLDDDHTAEQVGSQLSYFAKTDEVTRDTTAAGSFTYLINPDYVPKRAQKADPAAAAPAPVKRERAIKQYKPRAAAAKLSPAVKQAKRKYTKHTKSAPPSKAITLARSVATPVAIDAHGQIAGVVIERESLRTMTLALMHLHPDPMPDSLKSAVIDAFQATL